MTRLLGLPLFLDVRQRPNFYPAPVHDERRGRKALGAGQLPHAASRVAPTGDKVGLSKPESFLGWWGLRAVLHGDMHRGFGGVGVGCFLACRMAGYGSPDGEPARIDNCQCISAHSVGSASRPAAGRGRRPSPLLAPCQSSRVVGFAASVPARSFQLRGISPAAGGWCWPWHSRVCHTGVGVGSDIGGRSAPPSPPSGYSATCEGGLTHYSLFVD